MPDRRLVLVVGGILIISLFILFPAHTTQRIADLATSVCPPDAHDRVGTTGLLRFVQSWPQPPLQHPRPEAEQQEDDERPEDDEGLSFWNDRTRDGRAEFDWPRTRKLFVFGDSFSSLPSDPDYRRNGVGNGHPDGLDKHIGLKWADYLYNTHKDPAETQYWNFARDGATIERDLVQPRLETSGCMDDQLAEFTELFTPMPGPDSVDWKSDDALFIVLFGVNDVREMSRREFPSADLQRTAGLLPYALTDRLSTLYKAGARHFLLFNLAALHDAPKYHLASGIGHNITAWLKAGERVYNHVLPGALAAFEDTHPQANTMLFDWRGLYLTMRRFPEAFGITDCTRFAVSVAGKEVDAGRMGMCYQDPSHPTWLLSSALAASVNGLLHRSSRSWWRPEKLLDDRIDM